MITNENVRAFIEYQFAENFRNHSRYLDEHVRDRFPALQETYKEQILNGKELPASYWNDLKEYNLQTLFYQLINSSSYDNKLLEKGEQCWFLHEPFMRTLFDLKQSNAHHTGNTYAVLAGLLFAKISLLPYAQARKAVEAYGFTDELILDVLSHIPSYQTTFFHSENQQQQLSFTGNFLLDGKKSGFSLLKKSGDNHIAAYLENIEKKDQSVGSDFMRFLLQHAPEKILVHYKILLLNSGYHGGGVKQLDEEKLKLLSGADYADLDALLDQLFQADVLTNRDKLAASIYVTSPSSAQQQQIRLLIFHFFEDAKNTQSYWSLNDRFGDWRSGIYVYGYALQFFRKYFPDEMQVLIRVIVDETHTFTTQVIQALKAEFGVAAVQDIVRYITRREALKAEEVIIDGLELIMELDGFNNRSVLIEIGTATSNKRIQHAIAGHFLALGDAVTEELKELLNTPNVANRYLAAYVLSRFEDAGIRQHLLGFVDQEKNDDTRDTLIETLKDELYPESFGFDDLQQLIDKADKRKKLNAVKEKGIELAELPALYWQDGNALTTRELTFLFYRNARSKGLNSDAEARLLTRFADKEKTAKFSRYILKAFLDQGAQAKQKHLMMLAALLGNDSTVPLFETLFKRMIDEKRVKVAEMVIHNTMIIGTNKALRFVEFISRKYANKKPALAEAARNALEAAARELNLSADELADRIIPNFDFEDLQRIVEVDGVEYRAMIDLDFSLVFYDENNKKRKSLPKNASKELKEEMSAIAKDLKAVVRMQSGRMEQFLQIGKQWPTGYWMDLFMNHPIMFVYAAQLLWIGEKADGTREVFRVLEDALMVDIESEEVDIDAYTSIGLYHPILVDETTGAAWKNHLYTAEITTLVEQVNRPCYLIDASAIQAGKYDMPSKAVPKGAEFVKSYLEKRGWSKETIDGGMLQFYKRFPALDLLVEPWINGPCAFYLEGQTADVEHIEFRRLSDRKAHSLEGVTPVLLSEIFQDMHHLMETN